MNTALAAVGPTLAQKYAKIFKAAKDMCSSNDPRIKSMVAGVNADLKRLALTPNQVHNNSTLATVSLAYANEAYIGLGIMPVAQVGKLSDDYTVFDRRGTLGFPDDAMTSRARANEVSAQRSTASYSCKPYGLKDFVDVLTVMNQDEPLNEMLDLVQLPAEGIAFNRELRIAAAAGNTANYGGNTAAIAAGNRWDTAGGGDPIGDIMTAKAAIWQGRGGTKLVAWTSLAVWNVLSRHPAILDLFKYGGATPGLAKRDMLADWLGIDEILVGSGIKDTTNEGQTEVDARIWPDSFGLARVATAPSLKTAAWGFTMRFGQVATDQWFDQAVGTRGGYYARVSTHEDHKVVSPQSAYLLTTVIG